MKLITTAKLPVLFAIAGVAACSPEAKVERAQQQEQKAARETAEKRAELSREQRDEAAERVKEAREDRAELEQKARETVLDEQREAVKQGADQMKERARVESAQAEKQSDATRKLNEANAELDQERIKLQSRSQERLGKIVSRADSINTRAQRATPEDKTVIDRELSSFNEAREAAERDIEALATVREQNLRRAEKTVDGELAKLEKKLERVESKLP